MILIWFAWQYCRLHILRCVCGGAESLPAPSLRALACAKSSGTSRCLGKILRVVQCSSAFPAQLTDTHCKPLGLAKASRAWYGLSLAQECLSLATAKQFQTCGSGRFHSEDMFFCNAQAGPQLVAY